MSILFSLIKDLLGRTPLKDGVQPASQHQKAPKEKELDDVIARNQQLLKANPRHIDALFNLGAAYEVKNMMPQAIDCYRAAIAINSQYYPPKISLMTLLQCRCAWKELNQDVQKIREVVRKSPVTAQNHLSPFKFLALPGTTAKEQMRCSERYAAIEYPQQAVAPLRSKLGFNFRRPPNKKIRLGYLSSDFHDHATSRLMASVFEQHDHSLFEVTAYSYGPNDGSPMRRRLEKAFSGFVDIRNDSHEEAARKIYNDKIDILVDLKGYTLGTRSAILALRPAPIQVNYLGYPGTMGADFVDYLIADRFIIPPEHEKYYSEKIIRLPDCYQPTDTSRERPPAPARNACGLPEKSFIFCCFNQTYKISPDAFDVWCRLLKAVPESCLWLWMSDAQAEENLRREAKSRDIDPARLLAAPTTSATDHLARLQCADLFLDTLPYNAHTTCSDALWMGLPVLTCAGETFPSRVAGSLLTAMGVPELITYSLEDYYHRALELATDRSKLDAIRNKISANRNSAPLFDSKRFTRNLEQAYVEMMQTAKEGAAVMDSSANDSQATARP